MTDCATGNKGGEVGQEGVAGDGEVAIHDLQPAEAVQGRDGVVVGDGEVATDGHEVRQAPKGAQAGAEGNGQAATHFVHVRHGREGREGDEALDAHAAGDAVAEWDAVEVLRMRGVEMGWPGL